MQARFWERVDDITETVPKTATGFDLVCLKCNIYAASSLFLFLRDINKKTADQVGYHPLIDYYTYIRYTDQKTSFMIYIIGT
jgi:hypothetical protein